MEVEMKVADLYRPGMFTIDGSATLAECARRLELADVGALGVVDGPEVVGIITERDLVRAVSRGTDVHDGSVRDFASADPLVADVDEESDEVARRMLDAGVRHLPVVDKGKVVGMLSMRDLLHVKTWL
jgi:CBS domain-containing protein